VFKMLAITYEHKPQINFTGQR